MTPSHSVAWDRVKQSLTKQEVDPESECRHSACTDPPFSPLGDVPLSISDPTETHDS